MPQDSGLGVFVALIGNSLIGASFSIMKVAHDRNPPGGNYLLIPMWWAGTLLMILGELGNLVAYSLAKPSLISPLGAVSVVVNVPVAYLVLGEKMSLRNISGCFLCILGGYGIVGVVAGNTTERAEVTVVEFEDMVYRPSFLVFLAVSIFESVDLIWSQRQTSLTYIMVCSLLGGVTVLSIKAATSFLILTIQGVNQFAYVLPFVLMPVLFVTLILQVHYLNKAIAEFGTAEVVPTYYVLFTSCAVVGSAILYGDLQDSSKEHVMIFLLSFFATSAGVYLVANKAGDEKEKKKIGARRGRERLEEDDTQALL
mmetsp:Transcript_11867/g.28384  ORF Transcript_11867/g.28384 Transcript_11867/m.28384 type:complete len:312 (-) Transcript_11867:42-977(-)